jgi:hypothetical protein
MVSILVADDTAQSSVSLIVRSTGGWSAIEVSPKLCSAVPGRERWLVEELIGKPRWAAAVELVLRGEEGVETAVANPLTGRVLVRFSPSRLTAPVEILLRQALSFGPMSRRDFAARQTNSDFRLGPAHLVAAELGCFLVKMTLLGGCCFTGGAAAAMLSLHLLRTRHE